MLMPQLQTHLEHHKFQPSITCKLPLSFLSEALMQPCAFSAIFCWKWLFQKRETLLWKNLRKSRYNLTWSYSKQGWGKQRWMMIARVNPYACITFFTLAVKAKYQGKRRENYASKYYISWAWLSAMRIVKRKIYLWNANIFSLTNVYN